jgi:hypothetical protein
VAHRAVLPSAAVPNHRHWHDPTTAWACRATRHGGTVVPGVEEEGKWSYLAARRRRRKRGEFEVDGPAGRHGTDAEGVGRRRIIEGEGWPSARHRGEGVDWPTSAALRRSGRPPARRRGPGSGEASRRREPPACRSAAAGGGDLGRPGDGDGGVGTWGWVGERDLGFKCVFILE